MQSGTVTMDQLITVSISCMHHKSYSDDQDLVNVYPCHPKLRNVSIMPTVKTQIRLLQGVLIRTIEFPGKLIFLKNSPSGNKIDG